VAAVSAVILLEGAEHHGNKIFDLTGPDAVTMQDIAGFVSNGLGKTVAYVGRSVDEQRSVLQSVGLPPVIVEVLLGLDALSRDGIFVEPNSTVFELTGNAPRSVATRIDEHIARFALGVAS
jgi:NAD(P)H dehydrogenase (quinone)